MLLGAEQAKIEAGEVFNSVVLVWGNLDVFGQVEEVVVLSGKVTFHPGSKLTKSLVVMGGSFESMPGANVAQESVVLRAPGPLWRVLRSAGNLWQEHIGWVARLTGAVVTCLVLWLMGLLLFRLVPALGGITAGRLAREWGKNLLAGLLGSILVPVLFALLVISILGIAVLPVYLLLLFLAGLVSYLGAALWAGHRLLPPKDGERVQAWGFLLGLLAFQFLWTVGGWAILPVFLLWTLGWGALLRGLRTLWK